MTDVFRLLFWPLYLQEVIFGLDSDLDYELQLQNSEPNDER